MGTADTMFADTMLGQLEKLIKDMLEIRYRGGNYYCLARAQGMVDGYMRAMIESGAATQDELLRIVRDLRAATDGPALKTVSADAVAPTIAA